MARPATRITLTEIERAQLRSWLRQPKTQARFAERARIILWAAEGMSNQVIAERLDTRCARISKWRVRFDQERLAGLADDFRPGREPVYDETTRERLLAQLDQTPPNSPSKKSVE